MLGLGRLLVDLDPDIWGSSSMGWLPRPLLMLAKAATACFYYSHILESLGMGSVSVCVCVKRRNYIVLGICRKEMTRPFSIEIGVCAPIV